MREIDRVVNEHLSLVTRAAWYAAQRHSAQRRKGTAAEPYVNHLAEVACLLASTAEEPDPYLIAAGWLHDTIEDTGATKAQLEELFGGAVAGIVVEVTDDKTLPKAERKRLQVINTPHKSERARLLKLADKISNLGALANSPPAQWDAARCNTYIDWAESVVASCRNINPALDRNFDIAAAKARAAVLERRQLSSTT
jgi:(p)ppGpp synthase/HD superfamily hydrolase